jgi:hypothetical protein
MFFCRSHLLCRCHQTYTCIFLTKTGVPILVIYQARHGSTHVHAEMKYAAAMPIFRHVHRKMPVSKWTTLSWHEYLINIARHVLGTAHYWRFVSFCMIFLNWESVTSPVGKDVRCRVLSARVWAPYPLTSSFLMNWWCFYSWRLNHEYFMIFLNYIFLCMLSPLIELFFSSNCYLLSCWAIFLLANTPLYALL